jgi:hypothetical protein
VQDLAVGAVSRGRAVGVEDQLPAPPVDTDIVVELAQSDAILDRGFAAVLLVPEMTHVTVDRRTAAVRPRAPAVAEQDRAADVRRDAVRVSDI